jgi:hypothetical protein
MKKQRSAQANLEKYIIDNKNRFEEEPSIGHFERFQQKTARKQKLTVVQWSISIAASIAILLTMGILLQHTDNQGETMLLCENAVDIRVCYIEQMNAVAGKIEILTQDFDRWDRQEVINIVQDIINSSANGNFESELPTELPGDATRAILADYYQRNLQGLERIIQSITN